MNRNNIIKINMTKNTVPKLAVLLFTFALVSTISMALPSASAQWVVGGSSSTSGGGDNSPPIFTDNLISINQNNIIENTVYSAVTASSGDVVEFSILVSDNLGAENITYLDIFLNHDGDRVLNNLKETYVSFSYDELFIQNPNGIIESATMDTILVGDDKKFTFNVTFAQTFDTSDILIRSWDVSGNQSTLYFPDALKIVQGVVTTSIPVEETTNLDTSVDTSVDTPVDAITPLDDVTNEITPLDDVTNEITSTLPYSIMLGGTEDIIPYGVTGAMVTGAMVNLDNNSILFNLVDADNGILTVSPSTETQDGIFMVLVDGEEANDVIINGNDVTVNFPAGTDTIEIIGTFVIPEFGTVAMMILIISIVSIIAITGKSRLSLRV